MNWGAGFKILPQMGGDVCGVTADGGSERQVVLYAVCPYVLRTDAECLQFGRGSCGAALHGEVVGAALLVHLLRSCLLLSEHMLALILALQIFQLCTTFR